MNFFASSSLGVRMPAALPAFLILPAASLIASCTSAWPQFPIWPNEAERSFVSALRTLPELRQRMFDARATLLWAASFPEREPVWPGMSPDSVALGLMEPVRLALNIRTMLPFAGLVALLKEDAAAIAGAFSPEQKLLLGEPAPSGPDRRGALWSDSPEGIAYQAEQREHARRLAETGFHDAAQLAREVRD